MEPQGQGLALGPLDSSRVGKEVSVEVMGTRLGQGVRSPPGLWTWLRQWDLGL